VCSLRRPLESRLARATPGCNVVDASALEVVATISSLREHCICSSRIYIYSKPINSLCPLWAEFNLCLFKVEGGGRRGGVLSRGDGGKELKGGRERRRGLRREAERQRDHNAEELCVCVCVCVFTYVCMYVCVYVCMCVCMFTCACIPTALLIP